MKRLLPIFLIFSITFISSCKKDDVEDAPSKKYTFIIPQLIKDYCVFKPGSSWIYKYEGQESYDSVYVDELSIDMITIDEPYYGYTIDFEQLNLTIRSQSKEAYKNQYYTKYSMYVPYPEEVDDYKPCVMREHWRTFDQLSSVVCFFDNENVGSQLKLSRADEPIELIGFEKEFHLHDSIYKDVLVFRNNDDHSWGATKQVTYYFAKNVGLIKRENGQFPSSWELISYDVEQ